jgi:hypothetical protein
MLTILQCGNFKFPFCSEVHWKLTLEDLGHRVIPAQEDETTVQKMLQIADAEKVDLFIYTRTWELIGDGFWLYNELADRDIPTASIHLDLYFGLQRGVKLYDPFWRTKYVFSADGDPRSQKFFEEQGINHFWLPPAVYKGECYKTEPVPEFEYDVAFVGSTSYHPEWSYRGELLKWLKSTYGDRYLKAGNPESTVRGHRLNQLYSSVKVVVGDTLCQNFTHTNYFSDRAFETIGRNGMIVHPYIQGMENFLEDRKHLRYYNYGDFDQLKSLIDYLIHDDFDRERIRAEGHQHVLENHTYHNRLSQMLSVLAEQEPQLREKI